MRKHTEIMKKDGVVLRIPKSLVLEFKKDAWVIFDNLPKVERR
jgi:hypothetical protein